MDFGQIRKQSEALAQKLGYSINSHLPSLEGAVLEKRVEDVSDRMLVLNCVVAAGHGFPKEKALKWLERENLQDCISVHEGRFLTSNTIDGREFMARAEGLWAFAWAVNKVGKFDFGKSCSNDLVTLLPDLLRGESTATWRQGLSLRSEAEIIEACDLAYVLHWSIQDALIRGAPLPGKIPAYAVIERRRALEWLLQSEDWDDVVLDT